MSFFLNKASLFAKITTVFKNDIWIIPGKRQINIKYF
jgi:hypothetical protein